MLLDACSIMDLLPLRLFYMYGGVFKFIFSRLGRFCSGETLIGNLGTLHYGIRAIVSTLNLYGPDLAHKS
jgi:hypothetical protein